MKRDIRGVRREQAAPDAMMISTAAAEPPTEATPPGALRQFGPLDRPLQGWARRGCDPAQKPDSGKAFDLQHQLFQMLLAQWQPRVRWLRLFMRNHSAEVLLVRPGDAKQVADAANMAMAKEPVRIRNCEVRAACDTSPDASLTSFSSTAATPCNS